MRVNINILTTLANCIGVNVIFSFFNLLIFGCLSCSSPSLSLCHFKSVSRELVSMSRETDCLPAWLHGINVSCLPNFLLLLNACFYRVYNIGAHISDHGLLHLKILQQRSEIMSEGLGMRPCKIHCTFYCHRLVKIYVPLFVCVGPKPLGSK